ncbi:MAG: toprim domain-containing protein, partial [Leeuwenhoekiella sp.]
ALTAEQIRLINRLTPNITVLFDGDAAGQRASLRGIDLILEQGMNVRVCSFPEGEDPDSFSRKHSLTEVETYFEENSKDFIQYKASLLVAEAKGDPVKKAGLIRDMVESISKIPDVIKREIYIQECARIMDIKEDVLFNTLAQILSKDKKEVPNSSKPVKGDMEVVKKEPAEKFKRQYELEQNIIKLLTLYPKQAVIFTDIGIEEDKEGNVVEKEIKREMLIYQKIYLDLQEDEVEFANKDFQNIYYMLIDLLNRTEGDIRIDQLKGESMLKETEQITSIVFEEERHTLHKWDTKDIYVKSLKDNADVETIQTLLNLRHYLIQGKMHELMEQLKTPKPESSREMLEEIRDYKDLEVLIAQKRNLVIMPYL